MVLTTPNSAGESNMTDTTDRAAVSWRRVWREGIAPLLIDDELETLALGLEVDTPMLIQGACALPRPMSDVNESTIIGVDALCYGAWQTGRLATNLDADDYFARTCHAIDELLGEPAGCRWFLNWYDETPRDEMRVALLAEVQREQERRMRGGAHG